MEKLVGRAVRKAFPGFGVSMGAVESYDAQTGYYRVLYEDGDSEEVDGDEIGSILVGPPMSAQPETPGGSAGKRPKKWRRGDEESPKGNVSVLGKAAVVDALSNGDVLAKPAGRKAGGEEKKRRVDSGPESSIPVRRSARQAKAAALAAEMEAAGNVAAAAEAAETSAADYVSPVPVAATPQQPNRKRQRANGSGRYGSLARSLEDAAVLPPKPELPPSSQGLDLEGLPVLDVFQVYSCLRSFSKQLFLSPFPLETFVSALRAMHVNPLIDWVHFALLRSLKSHLEDLAQEGDPPAIHYIRNLNWELFDLPTWPIYLAEYLLTRVSELRYGVKLTDLKLLDTEYYRQPATVKLELLRSLCDDAIESEAIRSELGSRMSELHENYYGFRNTGVRRKTRGSSVKALADFSQPPEGSDDVDDGNSDECYLCGMDGNLLCCDGCPSAFHSKCVGVVEELLPEGEWYCPECSIQKNNGSRNMPKLVRGAEVLGMDPHGRLYFGTCGYLLVVDSCDADSPCHYYGHIDLHSLVTVLIQCHHSYNSIVNVISLFWGISTETSNINGRYENSKECSSSDHGTDCRQSSMKQPGDREHCTVEKDGSSQKLDSGKVCTSNSVQDASCHSEKPNDASSANKDSCDCQQDHVCLHDNVFSAKNQKGPSPQKEASDCYFHSDPARYVNYYSFGQIAASAAAELKHKLSHNVEGKKHGQDAVSFLLKTVCKKYVNVFALTDKMLSVELLKEKCGWCNSCQSSGGSDCIFRVTNGKCTESPKPCAVGVVSEKNNESHIVLATHNILSIEERLNGFLSGPWQNPEYSTYWRKAVLMASDVSSLKQPLLTLESSLRRIAFSGEWQKPADSVEVVGSAAHILVRSSNKSLGYAIARKPGREPLNVELKVDSPDVGVYWWRGGTLSRQVFHWKRLPQSLASKCARQAGRKKIPTIVYPDGSQFARRLKYIAWRAAVEMAQTVSQLILQIKELESNIKWTEILSTLSSADSTKETQKIARLFKKVRILRKRIEATNVEYLLDFGKRENIPPVVAKHGIKLEEPSSERNMYWLSESHVPLSLLNAYEAKGVTNALKQIDKDDLPKNMSLFRSKRPKRSVFDELLEKAKKLPCKLCGQCYNKTLIDREAVNSLYCEESLTHREMQTLDERQVLEGTLSTMHDLVKRAEWFAHTDGFADLLQNAHGAVYDAKGLLDRLYYNELLEKVEGNKTVDCSLIELPKIKEVKGRLDHFIRVMQQLDLYDVRMLFMDESVSLEFNHFQEEQTLFGRPKELLELINLLGLPEIIGKQIQGGKPGGMIAARTDNVSVLPIIGISGVGKTTLANHIFSDKRVCDNFDLLIWLCVSDGFDEKKLIKKFIQSVAKSEMKSDDLSYLQRILTNGIIHHSRRFLLVLDDVQEDICHENCHEWKSFLAPLKCAKPGSMVLVTTRSLKVAENVGTMQHFVLEGLPEGTIWEFFRMHAFGSDNSDINPVLASIGRSIVSRLNGSPLGAQIIGRLLSLKLDPVYWRNILESELWEVPHKENEGEDTSSICSALKLSYQYLPFHLKRCFSFCSMYPRNYEFDAGTLVDCWVAVGLVLPYGLMLALDVGHVYFQQLVNRSFFQRAPTSSRYVMHDLVYDMAQQTSRNECFVIKDRCDLSRIPPNVRHLSVLGNSGLESSDLESLQMYRMLCSVICIGIDSDIITASVVERWFRDLINIRMLRFISCQLKELPDNVGNLVHLRYLDISACEFDKFPDSLWRLYNMKFLDVLNCKVQDVPNDIVKLLNIQRVRLKGDLTRQLGCVPGVSSLVYLQEMPYYDVQDEPGRRINELKNMDYLRGILEISGLSSVISMEQSAEAALHKKIYLNTLILSWHKSIRPEKHNSSQEMEVLEGLRPSSNIKHLEIKFYMGSGFHPSWLHEDVLSSLASLSISSCPHITTIFDKPSRSDGSSSSTGSLTGFRSLTKLSITWCKRLKGLDNLLHPECLPAIKVIRISNCEDLVSLPTRRLGEFIHLEDLEVSHCWSLNWEQGLALPPSLKLLKLEACGEFSDSTLSCLHDLAALTTLDLQFCPSIESIGTQIWNDLVSLENLKIVCCQGLISIGGPEPIARVKNVEIRHCPKLKELEQPFRRGWYC